MTDGSGEDRWTAQDDLLLRAGERVRRGLRRDPLTELLWLGEDRYREAVDGVLAEFGAQGVPLSIVSGDLDRFDDTVNDLYGHLVGDQVLSAVGWTLRELVRPLDLVSRSDGGGFRLILLGAGLAVATARAELARAVLAERRFRGVAGGLTASFGVATHDGTESAMGLLLRAEGAERSARQRGGNRVEVSPAP